MYKTVQKQNNRTTKQTFSVSSTNSSITIPILLEQFTKTSLLSVKFTTKSKVWDDSSLYEATHKRLYYNENINIFIHTGFDHTAVYQGKVLSIKDIGS